MHQVRACAKRISSVYSLYSFIDKSTHEFHRSTLLLRQKWTAEASASAPIVIKDDSDSGENASSELNTSSASFGSDELRDYKRFASDELLGDERIL